MCIIDTMTTRKTINRLICARVACARTIFGGRRLFGLSVVDDVAAGGEVKVRDGEGDLVLHLERRFGRSVISKTLELDHLDIW